MKIQDINISNILQLGPALVTNIVYKSFLGYSVWDWELPVKSFQGKLIGKFRCHGVLGPKVGETRGRNHKQCDLYHYQIASLYEHINKTL